MHLMIDAEDTYPETDEEERERLMKLWGDNMHKTVLVWFGTHKAEVNGRQAFPTFVTECDIGNETGRNHEEFVQYLKDRVTWLQSLQQTWRQAVVSSLALLPAEDGCDFS